MPDEESFPCFCCGVCCSKYQVQMTLTEAHDIAARLGIEWEAFQADYLDGAWPGTRTVLLRHRGGHCVFLEPQPGNKVFFCRVHSFKPDSCIQWKAGADKNDCREGLEKLWKLSVNADGRFSGEAKTLKELDGLLRMLNPQLK